MPTVNSKADGSSSKSSRLNACPHTELSAITFLVPRADFNKLFEPAIPVQLTPTLVAGLRGFGTRGPADGFHNMFCIYNFSLAIFQLQRRPTRRIIWLWCKKMPRDGKDNARSL